MSVLFQRDKKNLCYYRSILFRQDFSFQRENMTRQRIVFQYYLALRTSTKVMIKYFEDFSQGHLTPDLKILFVIQLGFEN